MTRAKRRPCSVCGRPERGHPAEPPTRGRLWHAYTPTPPVTSGEHRTPRLDLKVPDPDGRAGRWRDVAAREGVPLGELVRRALEAYCFEADGLLEQPAMNGIGPFDGGAEW